MRIRTHKKSYVVELADRSVWRIWPADVAKTLLWSRRPDLDVIEIDHEVCSHALVDRATGLQVRVSAAEACWPVDRVRRLLQSAEPLDLSIDALAAGRAPRVPHQSAMAATTD